MPNVTRRISEFDIYHIICRGVGKQIIFEDDDDRSRFIEYLDEHMSATEVDLIAWCLMGNHFHLVFHGPLETISTLMMRQNSRYARYFNYRHNRVGRLFQGRFGSVPIESEVQLLACVRYVHFNLFELGVKDLKSYRWSSYAEYLGDAKLTNTDLVLGILGGVKGFVQLHSDEGKVSDEAAGLYASAEPDSDVVEHAKAVLGDISIYAVKALPRRQRDECIAALRQSGLSIRQIERVTGVGRGIIARV